MHTLERIKYILLTLGLFLLFIASVFYYQSQHPFQDSLETTGTVIKVIHFDDSGFNQTGKNSLLVNFKTLTNQLIEFRLQVHQDSNYYQVGEKIALIYSASMPSKAIIKPTPSLASKVSIWANLGCLLILAFIVIHLKDFKQQHKIRYLRHNGVEIKTVVRNVELDPELEAKGLKPYRICTEWLAPDHSALHIFKSDYLLFDPSDMLEDIQVTVLIKEDNPSEYYFDTSFLAIKPKTPSFKW